MRLQRVILYENGIGYFERAGHVHGETVKLRLNAGELDDVLKTLTVLDRLGAGVTTVEVPTPGAGQLALGVRLSAGRVHDLQVSYAVPTPTWKAAYRVVLAGPSSSATGAGKSLLQGWAMVNNVSQEDWSGVHLTLATGAPMSFVHDLHTPAWVKRPDVHGNLIAPTVTGPIEFESSGAADNDHDGIPDSVDKCPDTPEDRDQFDDADGCPEPDNDHDRIPDRLDKCPNEPETYNGFEDEDGCPDRGRVVVTSAALEVLDQIHFAKGKDAIEPASLPILDAVAATLRGHADIVKVEIGGHASDDEGEAWSLASRRASAVRAALIERGIDGKRLVIVPYGATRPLDKALATKNRRVDFTIAQRVADEPPPRHDGMLIDAASASASVRTATRPAEVAGTVRYELAEPVTIRKGTSSLISILDKPIAAEDVYLFRPDPNAPGSARHPFRAVKLVNDSGYMLEPGPIAIFARGTFVGDSVINRLAIDETAWIPYALDGATSVTQTTDESEQPLRIVSIQRGVLTVENAGVRVTHYAIAAGRDPAKQIYLRHDKAAGFTAKDLPPGTIDRGDSYLIPLPLQAAQTSTLAVEEHQARRHTLQILDAGATEIGLYVHGSHLPDAIAEKLGVAIELRKDMGKLEEGLEAVRDRLTDLGHRADEVRANLKALEKVGGADALRKKLVASLAQTMTEYDALARKLGTDSEALAAARDHLHAALRDLALDDPGT